MFREGEGGGLNDGLLGLVKNVGQALSCLLIHYPKL
jgi:hypothetical protein